MKTGGTRRRRSVEKLSLCILFPGIPVISSAQDGALPRSLTETPPESCGASGCSGDKLRQVLQARVRHPGAAGRAVRLLCFQCDDPKKIK